MISKILGTTSLALVAVAAQAQGIVTPVTSTKSPAATSPPPPMESVQTASAIGLNPFKPSRPAATSNADPNLSPQGPRVDPVAAAIDEEMRVIREAGERLGIIDGKVIFRHQGRYLIEAVTPSELVNGSASIDPVKRQAALAGECVIRVLADELKNEPMVAAAEAATR